MSDSTVYAVASGKGGVGKTTLAINLGAAFAARDHSVVVVDADVGMANMATFLEIDVDGATLHDVLSGSVRIQEATYEAPGGFAVVPGGSSLEGFGDVDMSNFTAAIEDLRSAFDVVILDIGGGLSHDTALPLGVADEVLLVTTADLASLENVWTTKDLVERLNRPITGVVVTRTGSQFDLGLDVIEAELEESVLAVVPEDDAVRASVEAGVPVVVENPSTPASQGITGLVAILAGDESVTVPVVPRGTGSELGEADVEQELTRGAVAGSAVDRSTETPTNESDAEDAAEADAPSDVGSPTAPPSASPTVSDIDGTVDVDDGDTDDDTAAASTDEEPAAPAAKAGGAAPSAESDAADEQDGSADESSKGGILGFFDRLLGR